MKNENTLKYSTLALNNNQYRMWIQIIIQCHRYYDKWKYTTLDSVLFHVIFL